ncbi:predicted protein [Chaetomium globosum CBS 148.51]|uniref:Uncharacterized protein n=1 Tax=Chaetomium globosum (strain ATCC 6205 / CBS 148.51 / DSM 1962 / NBRC 6347 / NRRL 1970) TaxID=306901 RepID=Q2GX96_CHAGB|nr:uncharacterized protein CHGG_07408 [Chaetomium globosum CBS 148.51]EAQ86155.1 predicted protein [Chaetomium globosum CBS 148.51]
MVGSGGADDAARSADPIPADDSGAGAEPERNIPREEND